jgi:putative peptidoglycan lipid II flippase
VIALAVPALIGLVVLGRTVIRVLFEHGEFGADAGDLTNDVLLAYAVALPAYVLTEVVTRGLIAMSDTRTPLITNAMQLAGRAAIIALLLGEIGAVAIPIAFAVTASVETLLLAGLLAWKLGRVSRPAMAAA